MSNSPTAKLLLSDDNRVNVTKALTLLFNVLNKDADLPADFASNVDSAEKVLKRTRDVLQTDEKTRDVASTQGVVSNVETAIKAHLLKREKAIQAFNALDSDLRSEMGEGPKSTVSVWIVDLRPHFPKTWELSKIVKFLHENGFVVHSKEDGRKKEQTAPYLTATVGKPIRSAKG